MYVSASNMIASSLSSSNDTAFSKHFSAFLEKQMTERKDNLTSRHWSHYCFEIILLAMIHINLFLTNTLSLSMLFTILQHLGNVGTK